MTWTFEFGSDVAVEEAGALPPDLRAKLERFAELIEAHGIAALREPYAKHLEGRLWELRLKGRSGIARSLYVTVTGKRVVVLRTFVKKTQKTPRREIHLALARAKEIE
jgi:phage-related protein